MRPSIVFEANREAIRRIVQAHKATNPRVFGSVATGSDSDDSDLDLLIDAEDGLSFLRLATMTIELESALGISVDVALSRSLSPKWRDIVLSEASPV